jgi:hypothetical protein
MDFVDDDLNVLMCKHPSQITNNGLIVEDDNYCTYYELNKAVEEDAKQGCW